MKHLLDPAILEEFVTIQSLVMLHLLFGVGIGTGDEKIKIPKSVMLVKYKQIKKIVFPD